ncbi:unnamed protein product, partial [Trichogramma brassicae]
VLYDVQSRLQSELRRPERVMAHLEAPASAQSHSRLPQINVPDFSGRREDWESFRDLFNALIHQSSHLSNVERLYYLKTLVRGDARSALDSLQLTDRLVARLRAPTEDDRTAVAAVGGGIASRSRRTVRLRLHLPDHPSPVELKALCLKRLGITTPCHRVAPHESSMWSQLKLADPRFGQPGPVELLLGAGVTQRLMMTGLQRRGSLVAQNTVVGWTIWGRSCGLGDQRPNQCFATTADGSEPPWHRQLLAVLQQFWQVEDLPLIHRSSPADERCEQLFMEHHRDHSGRYVVRLPLKPDAGRLLGSSESSACASLAHLHRRMARDDTFAAAYRDFMQAYIDSGHMIKLSHEEMKLKDRPVHYIPTTGSGSMVTTGPA